MGSWRNVTYSKQITFMLFLASTILAPQKRSITFLCRPLCFDAHHPAKCVLWSSSHRDFPTSRRVSVFHTFLAGHPHTLMPGISLQVCHRTYVNAQQYLHLFYLILAEPWLPHWTKRVIVYFTILFWKLLVWLPSSIPSPTSWLAELSWSQPCLLRQEWRYVKSPPTLFWKLKAFPLNGIFWQRRGILLMLPSLALITSCHLALEFMAEDQGVMLCHIL